MAGALLGPMSQEMTEGSRHKDRQVQLSPPHQFSRPSSRSDIEAGIYLDYAATTPVDPRVARVMNDFLTVEGAFGNPASATHSFGQSAAEAVEQARREVSEFLSSKPEEIVWTSGATEAINLALKGAAMARPGPRPPHRHLANRAPGSSRFGQVARIAGVRDRLCRTGR